MPSEYRRHLNEILQGAAITFALKVFGALLSFGFFILLARFLDTDGTGIFFLSLSIITLVAVIASLGIPTATLRFASTSFSSGNLREVAGLHRLSKRNIALTSIALSITLLLLAPWLSEAVFNEPQLTTVLRIMSLSLLPLSLHMYYTELFRAMNSVVASNLVQAVGMHALNISLLLAGYVVLTLSPEIVGIFFTSAGIIVLLSAAAYWRHLKQQHHIPQRGLFDHGMLMHTSVPLLWAQTLAIALYWIDTLVLGAFHDASTVGIYNAALRSVMLIALLESAVNSLSSPKFAALHHQNDFEILGKLARRTTALLTLTAAGFMIVFLLAAEWILLIFGEAFVEAAPALRILSVGMFISVATSSGSQILMMSGHERLHRRNMIIATVSSLILNLLLVPQYGIVGAAIGGASGFALRNLLSIFTVYRQLGIRIIPGL